MRSNKICYFFKSLHNNFNYILINGILCYNLSVAITDTCAWLACNNWWKYLHCGNILKSSNSHKTCVFTWTRKNFLIGYYNGKLKCNEDEHVEYSIEVPYSCVVTDHIVNIVFNEIFGVTSTVILTPRNVTSLLLNMQVLSKLPVVQCVYYSTDGSRANIQ